MFRSGRLTRARLQQIFRWVERMPHNLKAVAKACNIYPADLLAWYAAGQDPECKDPLMVELAWKVAEFRAEAAAQNYERIIAAADGGVKRKRVEKKDAAGITEAVEVHEETVLPAAWAIEKIDELAAKSAWEVAPDNEQAAELQRMLGELTPTPLLTSGDDEVRGPELPEPGEPKTDQEPTVVADLLDTADGAEFWAGASNGNARTDADIVVHNQSLTDPE